VTNFSFFFFGFVGFPTHQIWTTNLARVIHTGQVLFPWKLNPVFFRYVLRKKHLATEVQSTWLVMTNFHQEYSTEKVNPHLFGSNFLLFVAIYWFSFSILWVFFCFHHQFNLIRRSIMISSGYNHFPIAITEIEL
jgi:hypothetical protein